MTLKDEFENAQARYFDLMEFLSDELEIPNIHELTIEDKLIIVSTCNLYRDPFDRAHAVGTLTNYIRLEALFTHANDEQLNQPIWSTRDTSIANTPKLTFVK